MVVRRKHNRQHGTGLQDLRGVNNPCNCQAVADEMPTQPSAILPAGSSSPSLPLETPKRSADQRREALVLANQVRSERATLKAALKRDAVSIATVLSDPPQYLASAKVTEVLLALPGYGPRLRCR